ncbi:protein kinase [Micromonospora sp. NBC_01655]|uniref:protein kinase domain-containing protein n=1 Tax=Micromonospora sp. NBC_01655 TaxID=2975983 RepID=UPI0022534470|nr:protein kinase [Micromonospora sp. NBC_01655]MCX4469101.1 protein kinase [Micromonospora sp. NBC_01655]
MQPIESTAELKRLYRLDAKPRGSGGFADVTRAVHKIEGTEVAIKRAKHFPEAGDRIKREILAQSKLAHPHIMPIWDHDPAFFWYAMPLADGNLFEARNQLGEEDLASILLDLADALALAHKHDLIHRDVSPSNILGLPGATAGRLRWVVADWGMVRVSPESVSRVLTRTGQRMGTPGYDAPELDDDPSRATAAVDVYSLGRVAAWFLTRRDPRAGVELLPDGEWLHWRPFVRACTEQNVHMRIPDMDGLRELLQGVFEHRDDPPSERAARLLEALLSGDEESLTELISLAESYREDTVVFLDYLAQVPSGKTKAWTGRNPDRAASIARSMAAHLLRSSWGDRDVQYAATPLTFVLTILRGLVEMHSFGLAQDVAGVYFEADVKWDQVSQRTRTLEWLADLSDTAVGAVHPELARRPAVVEYYRELGWHPRSVALRNLLAS